MCPYLRIPTSQIGSHANNSLVSIEESVAELRLVSLMVLIQNDFYPLFIPKSKRLVSFGSLNKNFRRSWFCQCYLSLGGNGSQKSLITDISNPLRLAKLTGRLHRSDPE